jgi:hypothetical protein
MEIMRESKKPKNLKESLAGRDIQKLIQHLEDTFEYDIYSYRKILEFNKGEQFSEPFVFPNLIYDILIEWGMNDRGAELSERNTFIASIIKNEKIIRRLQGYGYILEDIDDKKRKTIEKEIDILFKELDLVATDAKLLTFSMTMHFFLPNLLMPMNRAHTLNFFYGESYRNRSFSYNRQINIYKEICREFQDYAPTLTPKENYIRNDYRSWSRNMPKLIDGIIIAYMTPNKKRKA